VTARSGRVARVAELTAALTLALFGLLALGTTAAAAAPAAAPATSDHAEFVFADGLAPEPLAPEAVAPDDNPEQVAPEANTPEQTGPQGPVGPTGGDNAEFRIDFEDSTTGEGPSKPIMVLVGLTALSLVPAVLLTCTSFTKILVVLGLTRNALGLQQTPPNQVLAGLALFLSLFIMAPVLSQMNDQGVQPWLNGEKAQSQAWDDGIEPLRAFMVEQTGDEELALLTNIADQPRPENADDVPMSTLVPSYVLSELKQAFIIGFVIFIPFLVIDIVVSAALMSLGMMMMPPVMVSLPFKLLLFVLVDGWALIIKSLVASYG
jgi:flagellar biosynthesis protein FliP